MNCEFQTLTKGSACSRECGRRLAMTFTRHPVAECNTIALGDALDSFLTSHGITKEWYSEFKEQFGLPPGCDCPERKEWLNKTSDAHPTIANIGVKLLAAFTRKRL